MKKEVKKRSKRREKIWRYVAGEGESENRARAPKGPKKGGNNFSKFRNLKM